MMSEFGFTYESSIVAPFSDPPFWPYTLDHKMPHACVAPGQICPTRSYKGIWEIPLNPAIVGVNFAFSPFKTSDMTHFLRTSNCQVEVVFTVKNCSKKRAHFPCTFQDSTCTTMATCTENLTGEDTYKTFMLNFKRHYLSNRAPLGLHFHPSWFQDPTNLFTFIVSVEKGIALIAQFLRSRFSSDLIVNCFVRNSWTIC